MKKKEKKRRGLVGENGESEKDKSEKMVCGYGLREGENREAARV